MSFQKVIVNREKKNRNVFSKSNYEQGKEEPECLYTSNYEPGKENISIKKDEIICGH